MRSFLLLLASSLACLSLSSSLVFPPPVDHPPHGILQRWSKAKFVRDDRELPRVVSTKKKHPHFSDRNPGETAIHWQGKPFVRSGLNDAIAYQDGSISSDSPPLFQSFAGIGQTANVTPDIHVAVSKDFVVQCVNARFTIFDKGGRTIYSSTIADFANDQYSAFFSPKIFFDPWQQRWAQMWHAKRDGSQQSWLVLLVSDDADPRGNWYLYYFDADNNATWPDSYDFGYGTDGVYAAGNQIAFSNNAFVGSTLHTWSKSEIYAGQPASQVVDEGLEMGDGSAAFAPRVAQMQVQLPNADIAICASYGGGGHRIALWKLSDPLGTHQVEFDELNTADYDLPQIGRQVDGTPIDNLDCRLTNCVVTGSSDGQAYLFCGNQESHLWNGDTIRRTGAHMYVIDPVAATLRQEWLFGAIGYYYWLPNAGADFRPYALWQFARCGNLPNSYPECRYADWSPSGFTYTSTQIRYGLTNFTAFKWGSYAQSALDWGDYYGPNSKQKIWMAGEYATGNPANWGTWIGASSPQTTPGNMIVNPAAGFSADGDEGGPFSVNFKDFILTNDGEVGYSFDVQNLPSWLTATPSYGDVAAGHTVTTRLALNANAATLGAGNYTADVRIKNLYNGAVATRTVSLRISGFVSPSNYIMFFGNRLSGLIEDVSTSDNHYLSFLADESTLSCKVAFTTVLSMRNPASMEAVAECGASRPGIAQHIFAYNYVTGLYTSLADSECSLADATVAAPFPADAVSYISAATGLSVIVIQWEPINDEEPTQDGWTHRVDRLAWHIQP